MSRSMSPEGRRAKQTFYEDNCLMMEFQDHNEYVREPLQGETNGRIPRMDMEFLRSKKVKLFLHLTNTALYRDGVWGNGCINPRILDLGTSWRSVASFTPRPLCPAGEGVPGTNLAPRTGLLRTWRGGNSYHLRRLELRPLSVVQPCSQSLYRLRYRTL
jgi:hypothetical protein